MVEIIWSDHARKQLQERRLSEKIIIQAIHRPDRLTRQPDFRYRAIKFVKRQGKRYLLIVIYELSGQKINVITAFYTSKLKKYL